MVRQALKTACFGDKIGVVSDTLLDTPILGLVRMMGEGGAKKEMANGVVRADGEEVFEDDRGEIVHCRVA